MSPLQYNSFYVVFSFYVLTKMSQVYKNESNDLSDEHITKLTMCKGWFLWPGADL